MTAGAPAVSGGLRRGVLPLLAYAAMTAAVDVYAGNRFTEVSPAAVAAVSFSVVCAFFLAAELARSGPGFRHRLRAHRRDVVAINVTTAVTWLATLYALDYLAPAVVNVIGVGLGPVVVVLVSPLLRRGSARIIPTEVVAALGICVVLGVVVRYSFAGSTGLDDVSARDATIGLVLTVVCAIGSSLNIIYMKRLGEAGCTRGEVLAGRFVLMTVVGWILTLSADRGDVGAALVPGFVVAVIGVGVPIYVLQLGIQHTEPITTSLLISLSPLFAFALQLTDSRLAFSPLTLGCILVVLILVTAGALVRRNADRQVHHEPRRADQPDVDDIAAPVLRVLPDRGAPMTICAIVDAYGAGQHLPSALRAHGVEFVHVRSLNPDRRLSYRAEDFAVDIQHTGDLATTAAALRGVGVTVVVAAAESGVLLADQISAALGLPGNRMDIASARRDKYEMQEAVRKAGLATASSLTATTTDEAVESARRIGSWPVVVKPVLSAGSDNVTVCASVDEVVSACARIRAADNRYGQRNRTVLVQQYLQGVEHYVNTVSSSGRHRVVEVWRYNKRVIDTHVVYDYDDLLSLDDGGARDIVGYGREVLDALGIAYGAAHTEIMLTEQGPRLIESGARLGGGQVPQLLRRCVGSDQVDALARSIAEPDLFLTDIDDAYERRGRLRCVNLIVPGSGVVPSDAGWDPVRRLGSFGALMVTQPAGSALGPTIDMATCPGTVYLNADDDAAIERDYRAIRTLEREGLYRP